MGETKYFNMCKQQTRYQKKCPKGQKLTNRNGPKRTETDQTEVNRTGQLPTDTD